MPSTYLTPKVITNEALMVLHQKLNFVGTINRQYDPKFAKKGAKIGNTLDIRLPNQFTVRDGAALNVQDINEQSKELKVTSQKGVDFEFTSEDLTLTIDRFSERYIEPAMSSLAAIIETDVMSVYKDVWQQVDNSGNAATSAKMIATNKVLTDALANSGKRCLNLNTTDNADLVEAFSNRFNDSKKVSKNYREGRVASGTYGFSDIMENTHWPRHLRGGANGSYLTNGANQSGSSIVVDGGSGTIKKGDIFTIAGVNRVHPESKEDTGVLMTFVCTEDKASGAGTLSISPAIVGSGARQNVTANAGDNKALVFQGSANNSHGLSLAYQKDAFAFATADLVMPKGVDFSSRQVMDGISMRIVRAYDINSDKFPCRIDIMYGYEAIRPELACRFANN